MKRLQLHLAALAAALVLGACGGGGGYDDAPQPADPLAAVPDAAMRSAAAMVGYLGMLSQALSEVREAIELNPLAAMYTSETSEPEVLQ